MSLLRHIGTYTSTVILKNYLLIKKAIPFVGVYRPLGLQEFEATRIRRQLAHEGGKVVRITLWPLLPPGDIPGAHLC
jgi:hypothetical protein